MKEFIFDLQRFNPAVVLRTLASAARGLENAEDGAEVAKFVGDLYDSTKSLIEDIGNRNITSFLFESLNVLTSVADFIASKLPIKELPFLGLASSMSALEAAIQNAQQQYNTESSVSQDNLDGIVTNLIDFCGETVKIISFFVPVPATVKLLADMPFIGVVDIATATLRTQYLTKTNGKSFGETFWGELWRGVDDIFVDIGNFIDGKINSASRSAGVIKIVYDDGGAKYYNETDNTQINLPDEDNRLSNQASGVTVTGGTGNDTVFTNENTEKNSIDGASGNDFIVAYDNDSTIRGGDDDDRIAIFGTQNKIYGDAGKDIILLENGADSNTVNGGLGDDIIVLESVENSVIEYKAGDGNDVIIGYAESDVIHITGDYSTSISGQDVIISVGDDSIILSGASGKEININGTKGLIGEESDTPLIVTMPSVWDEGVKIIRGTEEDDTIENSKDYMVIQTFGGNDSIDNYGEAVKIIIGSGDDSVYNGGINSSINTGEGNDSIFNQGDYATIIAEAGDDTIYNGYSSYSSVSTNSFISGGAGNDSISNYGDSVVIDGNDGNDTISNAGVNSSISGGDGDDFIENYGENVTIDGGEGNDSIKSWSDYVTINGGAGNDSIYNYGDSVTIDGGVGSDAIYNDWNSYYVTVNGGDGDDSIINDDASSNTINGGNGNDYILNEYGGYLSISGGAGDDTIENIAAVYNGYYVNGGNYVTINAEKGNDLISLSKYAYDNIIIYNVGDGNETIEGFNSWDTLSISGGTYSTQSNSNDIIVTVGDGSISLVGAANLDEIHIDGEEEDLTELTFDNKKDSELTLPAQTEVVDASKRTKPIRIIGNALDNSIVGGKGNDTIDGASGDDTLTGGKGSDLFIFNGGNDIITDYENNDKISVTSDYESYSVSDKDLIFNFGDENSLTIENGAAKQINLNDNANYYTANGVLDKRKKSITLLATTETFTADSKLITIDGSETGAIEITGNKKKNYIVAGASGSTLNGGKGKDTLVGGAGADLFVYNNKTGNDIIEGFSADDSISLDSNITIKDAKTKSGDTVLKFKGGGLTVKDTTEFKLGDTTYKGGVFIAGDSAKVYGSFKGTIDLADYAVQNFDGSEGKKKLTITGTDSANSLIGGKGKDNLNGGAGDDYLWGGKGNDTFTGGAGNDTFIYQAGQGKDVIADYSAGDMLQILNKKGDAGTINKATFKDNTLTLSIKGGGKVILSGVDTSTDFNINGDSYYISDNTLTK